MYRGSKEHLDYMNRWDKQNRTSINIRFNNVNDKEVIDKLNLVDNKTDYIRHLILQDIQS